MKLQGARVQLGVNKDLLSQDLNPAYQFKQSVQANPLPWVAGTAGAAIILGFLIRRPRVTIEGKKQGLFRSSSSFLFGLARPALTALVVDRLRLELESRFGEVSVNSMLGEPPQK